MTLSFASNQSIKHQTDKKNKKHCTILLGQHSRSPSQEIFKTIDIERSMEGSCRTSLFLFSNKWLTEQGLVYFPFFEGVFVALQRAVTLFDRF